MSPKCSSVANLSPVLEWVRARRDALWHLAVARVPKDLNPEARNVVVCGDRILIVRQDDDETMAGGMLFKPDSARRHLSKGWIVGVGEAVGKRNKLSVDIADRKLDVEHPADAVGLKVLFGKWAGQGVVMSEREDPYDTEYLLLDERDVWAVLLDDDEDEVLLGDEADMEKCPKLLAF